MRWMRGRELVGRMDGPQTNTSLTPRYHHTILDMTALGGLLGGRLRQHLGGARWVVRLVWAYACITCICVYIIRTYSAFPPLSQPQPPPTKQKHKSTSAPPTATPARPRPQPPTQTPPNPPQPPTLPLSPPSHPTTTPPPPPSLSNNPPTNPPPSGSAAPPSGSAPAPCGIWPLPPAIWACAWRPPGRMGPCASMRRWMP